jgi:hypothetical protein
MARAPPRRNFTLLCCDMSHCAAVDQVPWIKIGTLNLPPALATLDLQTRSAEAEVLAAVGDGGFSPEEFELLQELGTINIQQVRARRGCLPASSAWLLASNCRSSEHASLQWRRRSCPLQQQANAAAAVAYRRAPSLPCSRWVLNKPRAQAHKLCLSLITCCTPPWLSLITSPRPSPSNTHTHTGSHLCGLR